LFTNENRKRLIFIQQYYQPNISPELAAIKKQAFAGLLWNKQYYHFDVERWLSKSDDITPFSENAQQAGTMAGKI